MNHEFWYLSRAAGFTGYLLLFVSVALGISMGTRLLDRVVRRNAVFDLHRFTTLLAVAFSLLHVYILLFDGYFHYNVFTLSLPFLSPYRAWQTAAGVFALYVLVLIAASFYVRKYIGYRAWRALHYLTFAMFAGVALHGITAGTDTTEPWAQLLYFSTGAAVVALIMYRVQYHLPDASPVRAIRIASGVATIVAALVLAGMTFAAHAGSGTPATAITGGAPDAAGAVPAAHPVLASFSDDFSGTYVQTQDTSTSHLTMDGVASGDVPVRLHVELTTTQTIPASDDESLERSPDDEHAEAQPRSAITSNQASLVDPASNATLCMGQLTSLTAGYMQVTCNGAGPYAGVQMTISSRLNAARDGTLSGAFSGVMQRLG